MANYRVVSSDNHVHEPPDLWIDRAGPRFKDRVPRLLRDEKTGGDFWWCDSKSVISLGAGTQTGMRFEEPEKLTTVHTQDEVRLGGYIPEEHLKDMDIDGVDVSIVYPTVGLLLYSVPDSHILTEICRTYNDWLAEFCRYNLKRLKGIAMLNVDDVQTGVKELERCARMGLAGAMITVYPLEERRYFLPEYEPLWAAAENLGTPLGLHIATNRPGPGQEFGGPRREGTESTLTPAFICNADHWIRMSLGDMIFSGVFERHPKLQVGSVEMELSWAPHFLDRLDYTYTQRTHQKGWFKLTGDMLPSDYFHRNVFLGFQEDALGIRMRDIIGVDQLMWGSDYPHVESTWPRSRQIIEEVLADCTEEERVKIAGGNAARVYNLS